MILLKGEERKNIIPLFQNWNDPMLWSCIQGYAGEAWVDTMPAPSSGQITIGAFCFFSGKPNQEMLHNLPHNGLYERIVLVPENRTWSEKIEKYYKGKYEKANRYAIKKEGNIFNQQNLASYAAAVPEGISIERINRTFYEKIQKTKWLRYLCSEYPDYETYEKNGVGFVAVENGEPVSGASSYTRYAEGIEVEVDTIEKYRRMGLALACASKLILECMDRGLYPNWDAANKESVALAEKLGYHFDHEYSIYIISTTNWKST